MNTLACQKKKKNYTCKKKKKLNYVVLSTLKKIDHPNLTIPRTWCLYHILSALDLHAKIWKIQKYYFLSMGQREHPKWCGTTHSDARATKVPFSAKMTKITLVNLGLTDGQTRLKPSQNTTFHNFIPKSSFLEIFRNFD